jgi:DNA-binding transcriptional MerR regulator
VIVISTLTIGDFSRATHLSAKTRRHCHETGLLETVDVDAETGYRRYAPEQIVTAQIIPRFRDLDMPLDATDVETRNRVIANHLARLESNLARAQEAVSSLRDLLDGPQASPAIDHRYVSATSAAVITDIVGRRCLRVRVPHR